MNETELQGRVVRVVNASRGGAARKLSHRFLVGIPDLMIKVAKYPVMLIEVKKEERPKTLDHVALDLTGPQKRFLLEWAGAGVMCGVMSFLYQVRPKRLWVQTLPIHAIVATEFKMWLENYVQLDDDQFLLT